VTSASHGWWYDGQLILGSYTEQNSSTLIHTRLLPQQSHTWSSDHWQPQFNPAA